MRSNSVAVILTIVGLFCLVSCGTGGDTSMVVITNSADFPVDVTIEVRGIPGKIACPNDVCGPVTDPGVDTVTEVLQPGESFERAVELRTEETGFGYVVVDEFIVTVESEQAGEVFDRLLYSAGAQAATPDIDASLITELTVDVTGFEDSVLVAHCTATFDGDDELKDCGFALLL